MSFIEVHNLVKRYHRSERIAGNLGAVRGLFSRRRVTTVALDRISFTAERGVTVTLTSHDMDDIEALCTRLMVNRS